MGVEWLFARFKFRFQLLFMIVLTYQKLCLCSTLNEEGLALLRLRERIVLDPFAALSNWSGENDDVNPCSWYGVKCSESKVVVLNLRDLCLRGTLASDLRSLLRLKAIFLRNNSFYGSVPEEIGELKELEILDLGYNNFHGEVPVNLGRNQSLKKLLLDNNGELCCSNPEIGELKRVFEIQVDENKFAAERPSCSVRFNTRNLVETEFAGNRRLLKNGRKTPPTLKLISISNNAAPRSSSSPKTSKKHKNGIPPPPSPKKSSPTPSPLPSSPTPVNSTPHPPFKSPPPHHPWELPPPHHPWESPPPHHPWESPPPHHPWESPPPHHPWESPPPHHPWESPPPHHPWESPPPPTSNPSSATVNKVAIVAGVVGGFIFLGFAVIGVLFWKTIGGTDIKPWVTGTSGKLEKSFVAGVRKFNGSELETACEDFSNVITSSPRVSIYKGVLPSGVEIAVTSVAAKSSTEWSMKLEEQFREKVLTLSRMNHKNFANLLGFCEEEKPFKRMMVFEYAPNGTLFEHLHVKEAEHLDWRMRLRIALGMANCLAHMHQLNPPIAHTNFNSTAVALSEDYAAKVSDFSFFEDSSDKSLQRLETDVYNFGVTLFEIVTGRIPYNDETSYRGDWASDYLKGGGKNLREIVDPTLRTFHEEQLKALDHVIKNCVCPDLSVRPTMKNVAERLKEINTVLSNRMNPRHSAIWWAEVEIRPEESNV